jgi:glycine oxidase
MIPESRERVKKPVVLVVGGGLVGLSVAWHLKKRGARPIVVDRQAPAQEASAAGAGMLPLHSVAFDTPELYELSRLSYRLYPSWVRELKRASGLDPEWESSGSMGLLFSRAEENNARTLSKRLVELGMEVRWLNGQETRRLEPALPKDVRKAMYLPETVQIRPSAMCGMAVEAARRAGIPIHSNESVGSLIVRGGRIRGVKTPKGILQADAVVLTAGAWAPELLRPLGIDLPIYPLRGQVLLLQGPPSGIKRILFASGYYIVPRRGGELYVGSTLEKAGFEKAVTPEGISALATAARRMAPGLAPLQVSGYFAGFRPGSVDGHPFLGPVPGTEGLFIAAGHHTHGHLLAAASGHLMAQLILDGKTEMDLSPFAVGRKPHELQPPWWMKLSRK